MTPSQTLPLARMLQLVRATPAGCWEWCGARDREGYGRYSAPVRNQGKRSHYAAHRAVWLVLRGPIPAGLHLDHLCRNRACVNPAHLEPVTPAVNRQREAAAIWPNGVPSEVREGAENCCPQGHPYDVFSVVRSTGGVHRKCSVCIRNNARRRRSQAKRPSPYKPTPDVGHVSSP